MYDSPYLLPGDLDVGKRSGYISIAIGMPQSLHLNWSHDLSFSIIKGSFLNDYFSSYRAIFTNPISNYMGYYILLPNTKIDHPLFLLHYLKTTDILDSSRYIEDLQKNHTY